MDRRAFLGRAAGIAALAALPLQRLAGGVPSVTGKINGNIVVQQVAHDTLLRVTDLASGTRVVETIFKGNIYGQVVSGVTSPIHVNTPSGTLVVVGRLAKWAGSNPWWVVQP